MPEPTNTTEQPPATTEIVEQVPSTNVEVVPASTPTEPTEAGAAELAAAQQKEIESGLDKSKEGERVSPESGSIPNEDITFDSFKALKEGGEPFAHLKAKPDAGKGATQVEVKPGAKKDETATAPDKSKVTPAGKVARDFTGFDDKEKEVLGSMSNDAFAYLRPQLLEKKKLGEVLAAKDKEIAALKSGKVLLPDNYYEHPSAFVLSPEYNQAATAVSLSDYALKHWQNQLVNIRAGREWTSLDGFGQNNIPIKSAPQKATAEAEGAVMSYITGCSNQLSARNADLMNVMNGFKSRHESAVQGIQKVTKENYSFLDDEKNAGHGVYKNLLNQIPGEFKASPLADILARSGATNILQSQIINARDAEIVKLNNRIKELEKSGAGSRQTTPTESNIRAAGSSRANTAKEIGPGTNFDDFKALKYS